MCEAWQQEAEDRADEQQRIDDLAQEYLEEDFQELLASPEDLKDLINEQEQEWFWEKLSLLLRDEKSSQEIRKEILSLIQGAHDSTCYRVAEAAAREDVYDKSRPF